MNRQNYYLVVMLRWGDPKNHSYVIALTKDGITASVMGKHDHQYRGNKYDPEILVVRLREQEGYWLVEQFDGDREKLVVTVCHDEEEVNQVKQNKRRSQLEVKKISPENHMSEEDMIDCHKYLSSNYFNNEEQSYLRDLYEPYIRKKLNII